jgi:hypothetical protein
MEPRDRTLGLVTALLPIALFLVVYGIHAGHGFMQDDYTWVLHSRSRSLADLGRLFVRDNGFYRPVVSMSFAVNEWLFGAAPLGYGLTNVALALGCAGAIVGLARAFELPRGAAWLAGVLWLMNFYFTKTAILWISGRTALILTVLGVLAATALVRHHLKTALLLLTLALLAKEEAVLLPFVLTAWLVVRPSRPDERRPPVAPWIVGSAAVLLGYLAARSFTSAMTPFTAPPYYRFTFHPLAVLRNVFEYADRSSTLALVVTLVGAAVLGSSKVRFEPVTRRAILCGAIWLVAGLGFAYILPVRSDLYAAMPAVGSSLIAAAVGASLWQPATAPRRRRALVAAIAASVALQPVYWLRTQRMVHVAEFSASRLDELERLTRGLAPQAFVQIDDVETNDPHTPNLAAAFGAAINDAYALRAGRSLDLVLVDPTARALNPTNRVPDLHLALRDGRLQIAGRPGS